MGPKTKSKFDFWSFLGCASFYICFLALFVLFVWLFARYGHFSAESALELFG